MFFHYFFLSKMIPKRGHLRDSSKLETSSFNSFSNPKEFCISDFNFEFWYINLMKFKPYASYLLLRMAHLRRSNSLKIPRGPREIGSRFPDPRGMKKCNPWFLESLRNENRRGIGIPRSRLWPNNLVYKDFTQIFAKAHFIQIFSRFYLKFILGIPLRGLLSARA